MFQDEDKGMKSPDIYIRTGESTALAVIKLVEILVACGAMILLLLNGIPRIESLWEERIESDWWARVDYTFMNTAYEVLIPVLWAVLIVLAVVLAADGTASVLLRYGKNTTGFLKITHLIRAVICGLMSVMVLVPLTLMIVWFVRTISAVGDLPEVRSAKESGFFPAVQVIFIELDKSVFQNPAIFVFRIIPTIMIAALDLMLIRMVTYHLNLRKLLTHIGKEIREDRIFPMLEQTGIEKKVSRVISALYVELTGFGIYSAVVFVTEFSVVNQQRPVTHETSGFFAAIMLAVFLLLVKFRQIRTCNDEFNNYH